MTGRRSLFLRRSPKKSACAGALVRIPQRIPDLGKVNCATCGNRPGRKRSGFRAVICSRHGTFRYIRRFKSKRGWKGCRSPSIAPTKGRARRGRSRAPEGRDRNPMAQELHCPQQGRRLDMPLISLDIRMLRSFVSVVQTGSITVTARQLGRTQPAITLQLQRLEELINTPLLRHEGRRQLLTDDGDLVLSYAKSILRLHDEMLQRLAAADVEGTVVLGTPDLYAAFVLPAILSRFRKAFPKVQVELRCELSTPLVGLVRRGEIDLALVTKMEGFSGGKVVGQEQLIWMVGADSDAHWVDPVP